MVTLWVTILCFAQACVCFAQDQARSACMVTDAPSEQRVTILCFEQAWFPFGKQSRAKPLHAFQIEDLNSEALAW